MATYTGFLADNGLAELATEGEVDFAAMTPQRAVHVTLRDQRGGALALPESHGGSEDDPVYVRNEDGDNFKVKVENAIRPDLSLFKGGRLPVDTGLVIPPPIAPAPTPLQKPLRELDRETDSVDVTGSTVSLDGPVIAQPEYSVGGRPYGVIVSTTAVRIATANGSRKSIVITNKGSGTLYIGFDSSVTTTGASMGTSVPTMSAYSDSGFGIFKGELWGIYSASSATETVAVSDRY